MSTKKLGFGWSCSYTQKKKKKNQKNNNNKKKPTTKLKMETALIRQASLNEWAGHRCYC
jgi:hypothetical protein